MVLRIQPLFDLMLIENQRAVFSIFVFIPALFCFIAFNEPDNKFNAFQ